MAEEKPSLHIDSDWKKQAQEEKKRLAEQEQQRKAASTTTGPVGVVSTPPPGSAPAGPRAGQKSAAQPGRRELPTPSLQTLVQSIVTQVLFYLGEISTRGGQPMLDLDMAKHHIDTLGVLEEKTQNNLTPEEKQMLDAALYEARMRYINVASRYAELP